MSNTTSKPIETKIRLSRTNYVPDGYPPEFNQEFRRYIRKRDKFRCAICDRDNLILNVHHIDYTKKNTTKMNCVTLCRDCHTMIHFNCSWVQRVVWKYKLWELVMKRENHSWTEK